MYTVLTETTKTDFNNHADAFEYVNSIEGVRGVFKYVQNRNAYGPVNIFQNGITMWDFDAGRYLTKKHNLTHVVI